MGGLISLYAIAEYPQVFGGAACLSTHRPGTMGTATLDAACAPLQARADALMTEKGYSASNRQTLRFEGAEHSEEAWAARLDKRLIFLFGTAAQPANPSPPGRPGGRPVRTRFGLWRFGGTRPPE